MGRSRWFKTLTVSAAACSVDAFSTFKWTPRPSVPRHHQHSTPTPLPPPCFGILRQATCLVENRVALSVVCMSKGSSQEDDKNMPTLERIPLEDEGVPIPFVDAQGSSFIECYADSIATVNGVQYTIGVPCDYAVALCYFDENEQLIPVELNDDMMDDVFPVAESIVAEEFGEELALQRTPQTLTLVGELEEDEDGDEDEEDDDDMEDGEEEVEILLSFEHRGKEFNLVRLLDPVLLVGKADDENEDRRLLLSPEESEAVMPVLEDMFLEFHEERDMTI